MNIHPCVNKIRSLLQKENLWYEYFEHQPVRTSEEAARIRPKEYPIQSGTKSLIVRVKIPNEGKKFVMVIVPGDRKFNPKKVKETLGAKDLRFAFENEVTEITNGVLPGGVPPFGNLFNLDVYISKDVLENEKIIFNAGDKKISIAMFTKDYLKLVDPKVVNIT